MNMDPREFLRLRALFGGSSSGDSGGDSSSGIYMAQVSPASDTQTIDVKHNLGTTDILCALFWAETMGDFVPTFNGTLCSFWFNNDIPNARVNSTLTMFAAYHTGNANITAAGVPASDAYWNAVTDENTFKFKGANKFMAGITYTVIIIPASAFTITGV